MPRVKCTRCNKTETVSKAGFVRGKQRFFCKECNYHFMLARERELVKTHRTKSRVTTIMDIAKIVGVSESTVSRALKDHEDISASTKAMIKKIAEELNYQPNTLARSLTQRETRTIGVIIPDIETNFFASILTGIQNKASAAGYKVMISQSRESHLTEVAHTHAFMNNWVDGLLICHSKETQSFDHIKMYAKNGIPIIQFDRVCDDLEISKVLLDDENGAFLLTEHLLQQNCKRIMLVTGPDHLNVCQRRLEGYKKALKKYKMPFDASLLCRTDLSIASILHNVDKHLEFDRSVDSIFSISDIGAIHIILHLKKKGVKIPGDICVVGFGNEPAGEMIEPALTTFNQHTVKFGETEAQLFFDQLMEDERFV